MTAPEARPDASDAPDFRFAERSDAPSIVDLVQSAYRGDASRSGWTTEADLLGGQRTDVPAVEEVIIRPESWVLLAETDGQLLGCCHLESRPGGVLYLGLFAVRPDRQGTGLGGRIVAEADTLARKVGATRVRMTVIAQRSDLLAWYERIGFRATGETEPFPYGDERFGIPTRPDLHFVVLEKPVA